MELGDRVAWRQARTNFWRRPWTTGTLATEKEREVLLMVRETLPRYFSGDPAVEKALKDFKLPDQPKPEPTPRPQPAPKPEPILAPPEVF
jgi:hypothetical protein